MHFCRVFIIIAVLLLSFVQGAGAQSFEYVRVSEMEQRLDSVDGYNKGVLLLDLAQAYYNRSISQSLDYCEMLRSHIHQIAPPNSFDPAQGLFNNPDSILDLRAELYFMLGKCYYTLDENADSDTLQSYITNKQRALSFFHIMLQIRRHQGDKLKISEALNAVAASQASLGQHDTALAYYSDNLKIYQELNNVQGLAKTYNNIAALIQRNDVNKAIRYLRIAMRFAKEDSASMQFLTPLSNLVDIYIEKGNYTMAIQYLSEAIPICEKDNNYVILKGLYQQLSDVYAKQAKYKEALDCINKYVRIKDSLVDVETMQYVSELAVKYETDRKISEIDNLNKVRERNELQMELDKKAISDQRRGILLITIILVAAVVAFIMAFRENRRKNIFNEQLMKANESINMSLSYASRLQRIIIRGDREAQDVLKDFFVIYKPKNIVSGDFYYVRDFDNYRVVAVADCTGHGVPAAFLSVLNITYFNEIFAMSDDAPDPAEVLGMVRNKVVKALNQTDDFYSSTDGMDCALLIVDKRSHAVRYAGAYIDLYVMKSAEGVIQIERSTHNPVSWYFRQTDFVSTSLELAPDDVIYMFSDGFPDQVEPVNTEKYSKYRLRKDLEQMARVGLPEQKSLLLESLSAWQGVADQIDDILVIGIRASSLYS